MPLHLIAKANQRLEDGGTRGKVVLDVSENLSQQSLSNLLCSRINKQQAQS